MWHTGAEDDLAPHSRSGWCAVAGAVEADVRTRSMVARPSVMALSTMGRNASMRSMVSMISMMMGRSTESRSRRAV
jgi:hypothetical protein